MTVSMKQELISPLLMEARLTLAGQYEELVIRSSMESPLPNSSITQGDHFNVPVLGFETVVSPIFFTDC